MSTTAVESRRHHDNSDVNSDVKWSDSDAADGIVIGKPHNNQWLYTGWPKKPHTILLTVQRFANINISQGSVAAHLR